MSDDQEFIQKQLTQLIAAVYGLRQLLDDLYELLDYKL